MQRIKHGADCAEFTLFVVERGHVPGAAPDPETLFPGVKMLHHFIHRVLFKFLPKIPRPRSAQNQMGPKLPEAGQRGGVPDHEGHDFPVSGIRPNGRLGFLTARIARKRPRASALNDPLAQLAFRQPQAGAQCGRETADEFGQFNLPEELARPVHRLTGGHIAQATHAEGHALRRIPAQILKNVRPLRPQQAVDVLALREKDDFAGQPPRQQHLARPERGLAARPVAVEKQLHMRRKP